MNPSIQSKIIDPPVSEWVRSRTTFNLEHWAANCPLTMNKLGQETRDDIHTELGIRKGMMFEALDALENPRLEHP